MAKVLVMGGGLAGLCSAWRLAELGLEVTVLAGGAGGQEKAPGTAPRPWQEAPGWPIFPSCHNFLDLLRQLGTDDQLAWKGLEIRLEAMTGGGVRRLSAAPATLGGIVELTASHFSRTGSWPSLLESLKVLVAAGMSSRCAGPAPRWPRRDENASVPPPLGLLASALALTAPLSPSPRATGSLVRLLFGADSSGKVGIPSLPPGELWERPLLAELEKEGARVVEGDGVACLELEGDRVTRALLRSGEALEADAFVSSLSPRELARILPARALSAPPFQALGDIPWARVGLLHLTTGGEAGWGNAIVLPIEGDEAGPRPHFLVLTSGRSGSDLFAVFPLSGADAEGVEGHEEAVRRYAAMLGAPGARPYRATFQVGEGIPLLPGVPGKLPGTRTCLRNLYLCGSWIRSPFVALPLEAAAWTANRCVELMALDLLGKSLAVNRVNRLPSLLPGLPWRAAGGSRH